MASPPRVVAERGYANAEVGQDAREDAGRAMQAILSEIAEEARLLGDEFSLTAPGELRERAGV